MDELPIVWPAKYTLVLADDLARVDGQWVLEHLRIAEAEYVRAETEMDRYQAIAHYYASLSLLGNEVPILASEAVGGG